MKKLREIYVICIICTLIMLGTIILSCDKSTPCDRVCLEGIADQYLEAMVEHDASKAPFADNVIFTENTVKLPLTEGLWFTASDLGDFGINGCENLSD